MNKDVSFKDLTTFKTGGNIKYYFEVTDKNKIIEKVRFAKQNNLPIFILGGGSDILVSDNDFNGVVIKYVGKSINFADAGEDVVVTSEAGAVWDDLVAEAVERNLGGIECLSAIPGTVGAAPIQNIGAYGQELKDTFRSLLAFDIENEKFQEFNKEDCQFDYRESIFKKKEYWQKYVICEVKLKLLKHYSPIIKYESLSKYLDLSKPHSLKEVREAVVKVRSEKLEDYHKLPNAGSFFKNPIISEEKKKELELNFPEARIYPYKDKYKVFAGWLVEKAGWKGRSLGPVKVSDKHALIIVNPENKGTTSDIKKLADNIKSDVLEMFGIELEPEVQFIAFA